jgi:hypothetical protein
MTAADPPIYVEFKGNATNLTSTINKAKGDIKAFGKQADDTSKSVKTSSGMMKAALATISVAAVVGCIKSMVTAASNLQESMTKVDVVFAGNATKVQEWAKTTGTSFGINRQAALEAAGTYGNLLRAFGLTEKQAYEMSTSMVELAGDLASFNNTSVDDALLALRSGLSGEMEPLKKFGVALTDVRLKEKALSMGLIKTTTGTLPPAIKTQAAYALILQDTSLAQGDMARTAGGYANQLRFMQSGIEDAKTSLGEALLPAMVTMVTYINEKVIPILQNFINGLTGKVSLNQAMTDSMKKAYAWGDLIRRIVQTVVNYKKYIIIFGATMVGMWMIAKIAAAGSAIISIITTVIGAYKKLRTAAVLAATAMAFGTGGVSALTGAAGAVAMGLAIAAAMTAAEKAMNAYSDTVENLPSLPLGGSGGSHPAAGTDSSGSGTDVTLPTIGDASATSIGGGSGKGNNKAIEKAKAAIKKFVDKIKAARTAGLAAIKNAPNLEAAATAAAAYATKTKGYLQAAKDKEKETRGTKAHAAAVAALALAQKNYNEAVKKSKDLNKKLADARAKAAQRAIDEQNRLYRAMQRNREASRSWLAATARASGPTQANFGGFIEVPVVIDGQTVFRATQRYSLINNRRNVTNGLATSGSLI